MSDTYATPSSPIAVVGVGAIMPEAPDADAFWANITGGRYSITDVPVERWDPALYFSPDHAAPDKTYSTIGGWVRDYPWDPIRWKLPIPPKVADQMDDGQRWAITAARAALVDAGWPNWTTDPDNVAVIIGNAIGGEKHYQTNMRIELPELLRDLVNAESFAALPAEQREHILEETRSHFLAHYGEINEDTMPGELANVMAGRIANLFNFRGPNFTTDAACASGLAAMSVAVEGLVDHRFDAAITGGIDRNMGVAGVREVLQDRRAFGHRYATVRRRRRRVRDGGGRGAVRAQAARGRRARRRQGLRRHPRHRRLQRRQGQGHHRPQPDRQRLAVQRAWEVAGEDPGTVSAIEAHGTSTRVGDATELESLTDVFGAAGVATHGVALGSVKSNIGHLKAAAGAAGMFKMVRSLHDKVLAPSLNFNDPNPNVDWDTSPFVVNTELREWAPPPERHPPRRSQRVRLRRHQLPRRARRARAGPPQAGTSSVRHGFRAAVDRGDARRRPRRGSGQATAAWCTRARWSRRNRSVATRSTGCSPTRGAGELQRRRGPTRPSRRLAVRIAVDYADAADLAAKLEKAIKAFAGNNAAIFRMLRQQGVFVGRGPAPKVAFLYTGQGSQYVNMLAGSPRHRADRGRHVSRGRRRHDAAARTAAHVLHLHRR